MNIDSIPVSLSEHVCLYQYISDQKSKILINHKKSAHLKQFQRKTGKLNDENMVESAERHIFLSTSLFHFSSNNYKSLMTDAAKLGEYFKATRQNF